jgi:UDP-N-acetylmuramoyl-tripeptide--D-alanyl-D-alanine ligase
MIEVPALWTSEEAARVTKGRAEGSWRAEGVSIDSRTLVPGDVFVALQGPTFDGHAFVADALARGAAAAVVARRPDGLAGDAALLLVGDTFAALQDLGRAARARSNARIVGVTGSVGKTGVKEALLLALGRQGSTHASTGSFNNHWGVPLSLARMPTSARFAVFEMGMNHAGEIAPLTRQVRPHVAVITTVEAVHIENFPSVEAIAEAKGEIFLGVEKDGTAVLERDSPHFERLRRLARGAGVGRILSFGRSAQADVRLRAAEEERDGGTTVRADVFGMQLAYRVGIAGSHWVTNSLCVLAAVHALGADVAAAAAALADLRPPKGRGLRTSVSLPHGRFELIDDSYNASPASMAASFEVLRRSRPADGGRRIAVLGDMLELGADAPALHAGLARVLVENRIDLVFTAGPLMSHLRAALPAEMCAAHGADSTALAPEVTAAVRPGDVISVKGSAGSRMRTVVEALLALQSGAAADVGSRPPAQGD